MSDNIQVSKPTVPMQNRGGGYFYPLTSGDQVIINDNQKLGNLFDLIYPVGSIYMSMNDTDPSILFGGTWEQIKDRFLLCAGSTYTAGTTGGSDSHNHSLSKKGGANMRKYSDTFVQGEYTSAGKMIPEIDGRYWKTVTATDSSITTIPYQSNMAGIGLYGVTEDKNILPPYLAVYVWQRIG